MPKFQTEMKPLQLQQSDTTEESSLLSELEGSAENDTTAAGIDNLKILKMNIRFLRF